MNNTAVRPSTLEGIKRLAKSIGRDKHIPHHEALDEAANAAGFESLRHAKNRLEGVGAVPQLSRRNGHEVYITAYWRDKAGQSGRETLRLVMIKPLCAPRVFAKTRRLAHFKVDAIDHVECTTDIRDQEAARESVCAAARMLVFMDVSGLVPASHRQSPIANSLRDMYRRDHPTAWIDPVSGTEVACDEPYSDDGELLEPRRAWLAERGLHVVLASWSGMYVAQGAELYLVSRDRRLLEGIVQRLGEIDRGLADPAHWVGESADYVPVFLSPERLRSGIRKRGRPQPPIRGVARNGALPYTMGPWRGVDWRPMQQMPVSAHQEIGALLKTLGCIRTGPARVWANLDRTRCELDDWVQAEYPSKTELSDEVFRQIYYGNSPEALPTGLTPRTALDRVATLLSASYNDCAPLRAMLRRLVTAGQLMKH